MNKFNSIFVKKFLYPVFLVLIAINVFILYAAIADGTAKNTELYFLDIGQGDSQFVVLPGGVQILIDGGTGPRVLDQLAKVMPPYDRYIDLVILTHPQLDHFGGLIDVFKYYRVGAFIDNGREGTAKAYGDLKAALEKNGARHLVLKAGDVIKHDGAVFKILNPSRKNLASKELNDTSLVMLFEKDGLKALYTADIGFDVEKELLAKYNLSSQVLKVGHHGSKYSTGSEFLNKVKPKVSVIEVGKNNYGHPTAEALNRLARAGGLLLRTDRDGTVKLVFDGQKLLVYQ